MNEHRGIIMVANRSPYDFDRGRVRRGGGGLVETMRNIVGDEGIWIGLSRGNEDFEKADEDHRITFGALTMRKIFVPERQFIPYYNECANGFLWPLMHLTSGRFDREPETTFPVPVFSERGFDQYLLVGRTFATAVMDTLLERPGTNVWLHDYHFMTVARGVRKFVEKRRSNTKIGLFWHIPWVNPCFLDELAPEGTNVRRAFAQLSQSLLANDLLGFQIEAYARNFVRTLEVLGINASVEEKEGGFCVTSSYGKTFAGAFPIGVNVDGVVRKTADAQMGAADYAGDEPAIARAAEHASRGRYVMVGIERLDYTKGLFERLAFLETLLERGHRIAYIGFAQPSRGDIGAYQRLKQRVHARTTELNGRFGPSLGYMPIELEMERGIEQPWNYVLLSLADACIVTTLSDGMNLVVLEAILAKQNLPRESRGAVVVGECGASAELRRFGAEDGLVRLENLLDREKSASCLECVMRERPNVSDALIEHVREHFSVERWSDSFRNALERS